MDVESCKRYLFALNLHLQIFIKKMKKNISNMTALEWVIVSLAAISVVLLIVGLFCPPPGQIHNSVILGVCALFAYATLLTVLYAIKRGADAKLSKGDLSLEINNPDKDDDND